MPSLSDAYLCVNCEWVGDCGQRCAKCGSTALMGLARILNRKYNEGSRLCNQSAHSSKPIKEAQ